ncbi:MAG: hypothetical protein WC548_01705 [Candidatus Pacearchaeota archaeon]
MTEKGDEADIYTKTPNPYKINVQKKSLDEPKPSPQRFQSKSKTFLSYNVPSNLSKSNFESVSSPKIEKEIKKLPTDNLSLVQPKQKTPPLVKSEETKQPNKITTPIEKVHYKFVGKESFLQLIKRVLPKEFIPTPRTGMILGIIFVAAIILGLLRFPVDSMLSGDINQSIKVGVPFDFLRFDLLNPENPPLRILGLFLDLLIYIFLSYTIDVGINYGHSQVKSMTKDERKKRPKILRVDQKKGTLAEKITEKLFEDV